MQKQTGSVSIHAENIMPIIKKWLYSDKDIFIRELVSNGCDAITKYRIASGDPEEGRVRVVVDEAAHTLQFIDTGIGMTAEEVGTYINQVAFSGAEEFLKKYSEKSGDSSGIIGHFGLGFYSAFMVADQVTIDTLSFQPGATAVRWTSADGMQFEMEPSDWAQRGTCITLHLSEAELEFTHLHRVREVLERYCAFLAVPVYLEEIKPEGVAADAEPVEESEGDDDAERGESAELPALPKPINDTKPLWLKQPSECTEEEYKNFYRKVFHEFEEPLFWVHLNVDYPFRLQGILYFPKLKQDFGGMEGQIKLFSGQVFVADNIKEVIPEFLMLLKGVIDCPDFPLNVSRSFLQNDGYVRKLSAHITKKVADRLSGMFTTERETYEKYWNDIHPFIKFGCMRDKKFYERMKDSLLLERVDGGFVTLKEYADANGEKAPDKVYYTNDAARQAATIALYRAQGIDVVKLDSPIDVNFISFMEYGGGDSKLRFARVDADVASLADSDAADAVELDVTKLEALFRKATGQAELKVEAKPLRADAMPAMLVEGEQSRRFKEMSRIYGDMSFAMPDDYTLILNRQSATVTSLAACADEERAELLAKQLYDLAMLANAPLKPEEMTAFLARSLRVVELLAK